MRADVPLIVSTPPLRTCTAPAPPDRLPPLQVNAPSTTIIPPPVFAPPLKTTAPCGPTTALSTSVSVGDAIARVCVPLVPPRKRRCTVAETFIVTVYVPDCVIQIVSAAVGTVPLLQFDGTFQLPPARLIHAFTVGGIVTSIVLDVAFATPGALATSV